MRQHPISTKSQPVNSKARKNDSVYAKGKCRRIHAMNVGEMSKHAQTPSSPHTNLQPHDKGRNAGDRAHLECGCTVTLGPPALLQVAKDPV